eukprot:GILJ01001865.1.p1 GENE.GILJ01001865.1~~GILJ01001865.1.p1  ORF type:complete len:239 (+),score=27.01 GILJ01001865.1:45-719(+)
MVTSATEERTFALRRYYTPSEVSCHNSGDDCWVSFFYRVYDLTPLVKANRGPLVEPLIRAAGQDITHWFNPKTQEPKTFIDPITNLEAFYMPQGRFIHAPPRGPRTDWANDFGTPWWKDSLYWIGNLSRKTRKIKVINMLTHQDDILEVCSEETMLEITSRYKVFNNHTESYTWKRLGRPLDMNLTLEQNHIPDDSEEFERLSIDDDEYIPAVHVYFNDDLSVA